MKTKWVLLVSVVLGVMIVNSVYAQTYRWVKYDDFNSGVINPNKWTIDDSSAEITIEGGRAKFLHLADHPNDPAWLRVKKGIVNVWGIKTTIEFEGCNFADPEKRDIRAILGGNMGTEVTNPGNLAFSSLTLMPYYWGPFPRLYGTVAVVPVDDPTNGWLYDLFSGNFFYENGMLPEDIMGVPYTFTMKWTASSVRYSVAGQGKITYQFDQSHFVSPISNTTGPVEPFAGIGTRSNSGAGPCTVYFDDVYVLRKY